jgi:hypothetical protein
MTQTAKSVVSEVLAERVATTLAAAHGPTGLEGPRGALPIVCALGRSEALEQRADR